MDVKRAIAICRSIRSYSPESIPDGLLQTVLEALRTAPSASNLQPYRFVVVREAAARRQLASAARSQFYMAEAPVIVVACGYPGRAHDFLGGLGNSLPYDVAVAFDRMMVTAASVGLASCWIGAYDEEEIRQILGIPAAVRVVGMTPLGYPSDPDLLRPPGPEERRSFDDIISFDRYPQDAS